LFFVKNQNKFVIDYTSSYILVGKINLSGSTGVYIPLSYSYQFIEADVYTRSSRGGYQIGDLLQLIQGQSTTTSTLYYKIFNPLNLAFRTSTGICRMAITDEAD
jgi:hypothetical protein